MADIAGTSRAAERLRDEPCCLDCVRGDSGWPVTALSGVGVCVAAFQTVSRKLVIQPLRREAQSSVILSRSATGMGQSTLLVAAIQVEIVFADDAFGIAGLQRRFAHGAEFCDVH